MDGIDLMLASHTQDIFNIKVSIRRAFALANLISLVGLITMQGKGIFFRIYSNGANAQLIAGTENADSYFATICN